MQEAVMALTHLAGLWAKAWTQFCVVWTCTCCTTGRQEQEQCLLQQCAVGYRANTSLSNILMPALYDSLVQ